MQSLYMGKVSLTFHLLLDQKNDRDPLQITGAHSMSPSLLLSMNCSEVSILKATCQRSPLIQRRNPGEVVGYLQSGEVMMLTLTSGDERTFYFVEYYAEWAEKAKTMATKDERSLWVKSTQTTARQVCSVLKA